jgi:hypothetical protein
MYILSAQTKEGTAYFMNILMITYQKEYACKFATKEEASAQMEQFTHLFFYEQIVPVVEEI